MLYCLPKELRQSESVDFDDLIMLTLRLFDQNPDVLTYYQQKFQYIHVDEYQDTNHAQYQLVKLLASVLKISVWLGMRTSLSTVGVVLICRISWTSKRIIPKPRLFCWRRITAQLKPFSKRPMRSLKQ